MVPSHSTLRSALLVGVLAAAQSVLSGAAESARVVFPNGKSIPLASLTLQGDKLVVQTETEGFKTGQTFPLQSADHVYGEKPAAVNQAVALLLTGRPKEAQKLLEPVVAEHRITAKIPGNFWLEPARALLVAHAANGDAKECTEIGKEISEATPAQGTDPFVTLGKALLLPATVKLAEREAALRDLTTNSFPADVSAYAAYFRGNLFKKEKRNAEALEAYREEGNVETYYDGNKPCGVPSELADVIIRIMDFCGKHNINIGAITIEKLRFNRSRPHRHGGKAL